MTRILAIHYRRVSPEPVSSHFSTHAQCGGILQAQRALKEYRYLRLAATCMGAVEGLGIVSK